LIPNKTVAACSVLIGAPLLLAPEEPRGMAL